MIEEKELLRVLNARRSAALQYHDSVSDLRAKNIDYYLRRPDGHEDEGRSTATVGAVNETVNSIHAQIADLFSANDQAVEFEAATEDASQFVEQANELHDYVVNVQNNGAAITDVAIKDGLLVKSGHAKVFWEKRKEVRPRKYKGLSLLEYQSLALNTAFQESSKQDDAAIMAAASGDESVTFDVEGIEVINKDRVRIASVPSEELLIAADAKSPYFDDVTYCCHRTTKTLAELREMGYDGDGMLRDRLEGIKDGSQPEKTSRRVAGGDADEEVSDTRKQYAYDEEYITHDFDGDGADETRKICRVADYIFSNEIVRHIPFTSWCPIPVPHEFYGECPADEAVEFQDRETEILRSTHDSMHLQNMPRMIVSQDGAVNLDDVMSVAPGSLIRARNSSDVQSAVRPLVDNPNFRLGDNIQFLELTKAEREQRTGVTRHNQGLDGPSLAKTATGQRMMLSQSQLKVKQMARNFADMFLRRMAMLVMATLEENQHEPIMVITGGKSKMIPPEVWRSEISLKCVVGLGTGTREEKQQQIANIASTQEKLLTIGMGEMVSKPNAYETVKQIAALAQMGPAEKYFTDPTTLPPAPPPPPPLEMQLLQAQLQHDANKAQMQAQNDMQREGQKLQLEREKLDKTTNVDVYQTNVKAQIDSARYGLDEVRLVEDVLTKRGEQSAAQNEKDVVQNDTNEVKALLQSVIDGNEQLLRAIATPKVIVRGEDGRALGIQLAEVNNGSTKQ